MRTLIGKVKDFANSLKDTDRFYSVEGGISFILVGYDGPVNNLAELRQAILDVDTLFPWHNQNGLGQEGKSISFLSEGRVGVNRWSTPETVCSFNLYAEYPNTSRNQLRAYEKYLINLAQELRERKLPGISRVGWCVKITRAGSFE